MIAGIDLDHVAVAVERWSDAWPRYRAALGGEWVAGGGAPGFASAQVRYSNGMKVEVLSPNEIEKNDFLRRFLDRNGPGPHHLTFKVPDIELALTQSEEAGYRPVGVDLSDADWKEAFLHPKDAPGVVVQLAESHGDWQSPPPADLPAPEPEAPAELVHVAHAVPKLDDGLRLFRDLLGGVEAGSGSDGVATWVDLAWPGPGRVRVGAPADPSSPLHGWLENRPGRVHHVAFALRSANGVAEVQPGDNLGTRLAVALDTQAFRDSFSGYAT